MIFEVYFNGSKNNFCRITAASKEDAADKMKQFYPNDTVTDVINLSTTTI